MNLVVDMEEIVLPALRDIPDTGAPQHHTQYIYDSVNLRCGNSRLAGNFKNSFLTTL